MVNSSPRPKPHVPPPTMRTTLFLIAPLFFAGSIFAADIYMTPNGSGSQDGTSWANAKPASQMWTVFDSVLVAGDVLHLGSGNYGNNRIQPKSSGTSTNRIRVVGEEYPAGGGLPVFDSANWVRSNPAAGDWDCIDLNYKTVGSTTTGASYWTIENLILKNCQRAVSTTNGTTYLRNNITLRNLTISDCQHAFYLVNCDNLLIENCTMTHYTKHALRLEEDCDNVTVRKCTADMSAGDSTWWDYAEFPIGFQVNSGGSLSQSNILFEDCVAKNNLDNKQSDHDFAPTGNFPGPEDWDLNSNGILEENVYWNGDGFCSEVLTSGVTYRRCISINNEDGGFDIKQATGSTMTFEDCVAIGNKKNFKLWHGTANLTNCVATYPRMRGGNTTPSDDLCGIEANGTITVTANYFTALADNGRALREHDTGTITANDTVLAFTGSAGTFITGSVTLNTSATYKPGSGTNPNFVNPSASWNGTGPDMDNRAWGLAKGYSSGTIYAEADTYVYDAAPSTNYGTQTTLAVKDVSSTGFDRVSYLRFPLGTVGASATSAILKVTVTGFGNETVGPRTIELRQLTTDTWTETGTTWSNKPATTGTLIATFNPQTVGAVHSVDVTSYVNSQVADGKASFVLIQSYNVGRLVNFGSRENSAAQPLLEIQ